MDSVDFRDRRDPEREIVERTDPDLDKRTGSRELVFDMTLEHEETDSVEASSSISLNGK